MNKEYSTLLSQAEIERNKIHADRIMLNEKEASVEKALFKIHQTEEQAAKYKQELDDAVARIAELTKAREECQYQIKDLQLQLLTQKSSTSLEFEITSLKRQLLAAEKSAEQRQQEHEALMKGLMMPQDNIHQELKIAKENELKWKSKCQDLVIKLDMEFAQNDDLTKQFNMERLKNKELEREIADMKLVLHFSQSGINNLLALTTQRATNSLNFSNEFVNSNTSAQDDNQRFHHRYEKITNYRPVIRFNLGFTKNSTS